MEMTYASLLASLMPLPGVNQLGVLLMGHPKGAFWFGSTVSVDYVRGLVRHNTPTAIQVVAGIISGMCWAILHPRAGLVEPTDIPDHDFILQAGVLGKALT
jgi:homospermidine synthase